jgi:GTP-binding protein Era
MKKSGFVAIIGKPNAGKSTLMNALLGFKLSAVNSKAQTTRNKIFGILTDEDYQIIFSDTPGLLNPKYELQKFMLKEVKSSFKEADIILYVIDTLKFSAEEIRETGLDFEKDFAGIHKIAVLNKCDLIPQDDVVKMMDILGTELEFENIIPVSAENSFNLDTLKSRILELLPEVEFYYDPEILTDKPEKFFVSEIIREKILELYKEEVPYSVFVDVREFKTREEGKKDFINADIIIERETQKMIIIGKGGAKIKKLGEMSRKGIEEFLGRKVYLNLFVKVRKDWRKDENFINKNF